MYIGGYIYVYMCICMYSVIFVGVYWGGSSCMYVYWLWIFIIYIVYIVYSTSIALCIYESLSIPVYIPVYIYINLTIFKSLYIHTQGHSTAKTAAQTAVAFNARRILLNHISPQITFGGIGDPTSDEQLKIQASNAISDLCPHNKYRKNHIAMARDFTSISIPIGGYKLNDNCYHITIPPYIPSY